MKKKEQQPIATYIPPNNIHRTSDEIDLKLVETVKTKTEILYSYKYLNGLLKNKTISYTENEIKKQLNNYWIEK